MSSCVARPDRWRGTGRQLIEPAKEQRGRGSGQRCRGRAAVGRGQGGRELGARTDVELLVGVGEVGLDGAAGDVELLGDLGVALAAGGERGDAMLGRGERVDPESAARRGRPPAARSSRARGGRAGACRGGRRGRARGAAVDGRRRGGWRGAGRRRGRRARVCARVGRGSREQLDRLLEQGDGLVGFAGVCESARRPAPCGPAVDALGELRGAPRRVGVPRGCRRAP